MREVKVLSIIRTDGGTQARAGLDEAKVAEYAERMEAGDQFPALKVMYDGTEYWLYDGFHRHAAALRIDRHTYLVDVQSGTQRDARRKACSVNSAHGLPRTPEDKRRAVLVLLEDEEWVTYSDRKIADELKVSPTFVGKIRASLTVHVDSEESRERKYTTKHGTEAVMKTGNIGTAPRSPLEKGIASNVNPINYESINSLQSRVLDFALSKMTSLENQISMLQDMKDDPNNIYWSIIRIPMTVNGAVFRIGDLRQAVNNVLDGLRQQDAQRKMTSGELTEAVIEFARNYADEFGRTWADIENPSHTNGTFWQKITADFTRRGLVYNNQADLKFSIKQAYARMWRETEEQPAGEPVAAADAERCLDCGKPLPGGGVCDECFATCVTDTPAAVLNSEQTEPAPKPRIAPFVMGHFQVANEALARIYTAIPKSRQDDIHDFAALIATLERLERRIGAEYDMS